MYPTGTLTYLVMFDRLRVSEIIHQIELLVNTLLKGKTVIYHSPMNGHNP